MGVFDRSSMPNELKDLNLSPQEIADAVKRKNELETKFTELQTSATASQASIDAAARNLEAANERIRALEANQKEPEKRQEGKKTSFLDDEDAAFNERFSAAAGPIAMATALANARAAKMIARSMLVGKVIKTPSGNVSLVSLWDKWLPEIEKASQGVPPANLGVETTWMNIFDYVKGTHLEELLSKSEGFVESVEDRRNVHVGDDNRNSEKLNDEEASIANKMARYGKGVSQEKVLEQRKKMKFVGA